VLQNNSALKSKIDQLWDKFWSGQPMSIDWDEIIHVQTLCRGGGINGIGIPDLMIAQNSIQGGLRLLSNDKHFALISKHMPLELYH
jgi:predicted nucleic acid-binding protein